MPSLSTAGRADTVRRSPGHELFQAHCLIPYRLQPLHPCCHEASLILHWLLVIMLIPCLTTSHMPFPPEQNPNLRARSVSELLLQNKTVTYNNNEHLLASQFLWVRKLGSQASYEG